MRDFLRKMLSGMDNTTPDVGRVLLFMGAIAMIVFTAADLIIHKGTFDIASFGTAYGILLGGGGLGIAVKAKTEPEPDTPVE